MKGLLPDEASFLYGLCAASSSTWEPEWVDVTPGEWEQLLVLKARGLVYSYVTSDPDSPGDDLEYFDITPLGRLALTLHAAIATRLPVAV
jgi:hypothetical protein